MPNRQKSIGNTEETLLSRYEETHARLKKIEDAGYKDVLTWGCEFRKVLREIPDLQIELPSRHYIKYFPTYIRDALYEGRPEATKTYYRVELGEEIHYVDVISMSPISASTASFLLVTRRCRRVQTVSLTVWLGRG